MSKILVINHASGYGGAEKSIVDVLNKIKTTNEIHFVIENKKMKNLLDENEFNYSLIKTGSLKNFFGFLKLIKLILKVIYIYITFRPNIIISNTVRSHIISSIVSFFSRTELIWVLRDYQFNKKIKKILEFVPKTIICVSKDLKNYYNGNDKYIVIPNGFNLNINYDKNNKKIIRKAHKINNNEVVFGIASTFAPWKGIEFLIEGFYNALLKIETQNIKLLIAGSVDKDSNNYSYFLKLKKIVNDLSLNDKVYFVGWQDNIYNFIDSCDVIVSSSISDSGGPESFGRTIIEAWLLKKPVIATRSGGPKYIINNFYNGIFVKEKDSLEITNAIIYLAQKEERRIKMGLNGYKSVKDKYDLNKISDKYNEIIQKL